MKSAELAARFFRWMTDRNWLTTVEQRMSELEFVRRLTLEQVVRAEQRVDATLPSLREFKELHDRRIAAPGQAVLDLGYLLSHWEGKLILAEVNFDLLVETHADAPLRTFASEGDFAEAPAYVRRYLDGAEVAIPLLKLHGTISDLTTCVISTEQTERGVGQAKLETLRVLLRPDQPRLWIYVGASMRDVDLRPVLGGEDFARGTDERWVNPYLDDSVEEFGRLREASWRQSEFPTIQHRLITETADAFFAALRARIEAAQAR